VPRLLATTLPKLPQVLACFGAHPSHRLADPPHPPPPPSHSMPVGGDSPRGCDQTPSTAVTAARASSAPSAYPCPAELTMAGLLPPPPQSPAVGMAACRPRGREAAVPANASGRLRAPVPDHLQRARSLTPATPRSSTASEWSSSFTHCLRGPRARALLQK